MRRFFVVASLVTGFFACAGSEEPPPGGTPSDASASPDAAKSDAAITPSSDGSTTSDGAGTDSSATDSSTSDAAATDAPSESGLDATSDATPDAPSDAPSDAPVVIGDSGCIGTITDPTCLPTGGNFARCGTATATSEYFGFGATRINDGNFDTSWFADTGACPANTCSGNTVRVDVALNMPRTIGRVKLFGNREYGTDYDVLTARIELLDGQGAMIYGADVTPTRGNEPNGNLDHVIPVAAKTCVQTVRVIVKTAEATGPGLAEVEAFVN